MNLLIRYLLIGLAISMCLCSGGFMFMVSLKLGLLMFGGGILIGCIANDVFNIRLMPPNDRFNLTAMECIAITIYVLIMIPLIFIGSGEIGKKISWQFAQANTSPEKSTKKADEKTAEKKADGEWNELFLKSLNQIAKKTDRIVMDQEELKEELTAEIKRGTAITEKAREQSETEYFSLKGQLDAIKNFRKGEMSKIDDVAPAPPPETQTPPEQVVPKPVEPEALPQLPKGNLIPNTEPKQTLPDLWVKNEKTTQKLDIPAEVEEWPTHVLGSCGRAHAIVDWVDTNGNGRPEPVYGPCRNIAGNPACAFVRFGVMKLK